MLVNQVSNTAQAAFALGRYGGRVCGECYV
jgi:hypothetical protein